MVRASVSRARNKLSELLDRVRSGESVLITDRGRPIARLIPAYPERGELEGWLEAMERAGIVRSRISPLPDDFLTGELPAARASAVEALVKDREEGR